MSEWLDLMMEEVERKQQELDEALAETERRETSGKVSRNDNKIRNEKNKSEQTEDDSPADDNRAA